MKQATLQATSSTIRFSGTLLRPSEENGSWSPLSLSGDASAELPSQELKMVEGTINGFPFRAALEPNGKGSHWLRVNKTMRDAAGADAVGTVTVEITRAKEEPETRVPMDLRRALAAAPLAQAGWEDITPMARRDWLRLSPRSPGFFRRQRGRRDGRGRATRARAPSRRRERVPSARRTECDVRGAHGHRGKGTRAPAVPARA